MKEMKDLAAILKALAEPFAENLLQHKPQRDKKNNTTTYLTSIAWHTAVSRLDEVYPFWSQNVERIEVVGNMIVATVSISLQFTDGILTRTNTGIEEISTDSWGDPVSNAVAMAFKRAAALFGVGRYLYYKDQANSGYIPASPVLAATATATAASSTNYGDGVKMASEGQKKALWAISQKKGIDLKEFCRGKKPNELTMKEASEIIDSANK